MYLLTKCCIDSPKKRVWSDSKAHWVMTTISILVKFILHPNFAIRLKFRHAMQKASNSECCMPHGTQTYCDVIFHTTCPIVSVANLQIYPQSWMMRKVGTYFSHDFECMKLVYVYSIEKYNDFVFKLVLNQLFWFLAASLAASLAALAALWAITRSLRISTSASPWRNISLILRVSCWAASVRLTTSAYSLCSLSNIDGNWF